MTEFLVCPKNNLSCSFQDYCLDQKKIADGGGPKIGSPLKAINAELPVETLEASEIFCAELSIAALDKLALTSSRENVRSTATIRAGQIAISKSFFSASRETN